MRLQLFSLFSLAVFGLGTISGCAGGQTGDLSGDHDGNGTETGAGGCDEQRHKLADFDEHTDVGTANQLLAYAETTFDAPISWKNASDGTTYQVGPESGTGQLHISVTRGANAYQLTYTEKPASPDGSGGTIDIGVLCPPPALGVEAHVTVTTDGGALAESFDTMLRSSTEGVAQFEQPIDLDALMGSLTVSLSQSSAKLVQTSLKATLTAQGTTGTLGGLLQVQYGTGPSSAVSASSAPLAVWPEAEACRSISNTGEGLAVGVGDELLGVSGSSAASALAFENTAITWRDGSSTQLTATVVARDGCFRADNGLPAELDGGPGIVYPVTIGLKSADARLDGSYAGTLTVIGSDQHLKLNTSLDLAVGDVAQSGFASANVPDGTDRVSLLLDEQLVAGQISGSITLDAISHTPCDTTPTPTPGGGVGVPGCAGDRRMPLESATWSK